MSDITYNHHYYYKEYEVYTPDESDDCDGVIPWTCNTALDGYSSTCICVDRCAYDTKNLKNLNANKHGVYYDEFRQCTTTFTEKFYRSTDANAYVYVKVIHMINNIGNVSVLVKIYIDTVNEDYQYYFDNLIDYLSDEYLTADITDLDGSPSEWHNECLTEYNKY